MENNNTELIGFSKEKYQTAVANRDALKEQIKSLFGEDHVYDNAFEDDMAYKDTDIELMKNSTNLVNGCYARTSGFYNYNDGSWNR